MDFNEFDIFCVEHTLFEIIYFSNRFARVVDSYECDYSLILRFNSLSFIRGADIFK